MNSNNSIFGNLNALPHWYALHTRARHEKKVDIRLKEKGIKSFLPLNTVYRKWSDRYKKIQEPLFSCYVFVNIALKDRISVLQTDGAIHFVSFSGIPATIPEDQINAIKHVLEKKQTVNHADYFTPGKKVTVTQGALKGIDGTLVSSRNNNRLIITVDGIKQAISVEIDPRDLKLV